MNKFQEISEKIKNLKTARDFLKEKFPQSAVPPTPKDEEIYKLLTAIKADVFTKRDIAEELQQDIDTRLQEIRKK